MPDRLGVDLDASIARRRVQCRRVRSPLALLRLQVHDLTAWQQRLGAGVVHSLCDEVAQRLRRRVRDTDEVLLLDNGSYAVLLAGASPADAALVEARLREALSAPYRIGPMLLSPRLTMSQEHWPVTSEAAIPVADGVGYGRARPCSRSSLAA